MYTVYIPKYRGEIPEFLITKVIKEYMNSTGYKNNVILTAPGYMSVSVSNIDSFYKEIESTTFCGKKNIKMGIFNGMNGTRISLGSSKTLREEHEARISKSRFLNLIPINCTAAKDHRKMMFFMRWKYERKDFDGLNADNFEDFLDSVEVHGVLIGSSNQSFTTYFGGYPEWRASKGEADILMFDEKAAAYRMIENNQQMENIVVSESMRDPTGGDLDYLKSILEDFLKYSLV